MKSSVIVFILIFILALGILAGTFVYIVKLGKESGTKSEELNLLQCALSLYTIEKNKRNAFINSQCLGICGDYAVDIVHVPRTVQDNEIENQCSDYLDGRVKSFIEIDSEGRVVRIVK